MVAVKKSAGHPIWEFRNGAFSDFSFNEGLAITHVFLEIKEVSCECTVNVRTDEKSGELRIGGQTKPVSNCPYKSLEEREFEYEPYRVYDEEKKIYYCKGIKMKNIFLS